MQPVAPQVFISHARVDARFADALERTLSFWGSRPWVDRQQLGGGQEWPLALQQAIEQSAGLLVVLTPNALRSPMVRREYLHALSRNLPVLLIRFRDVGPLPPELTGVPLLDFRGNVLTYGPPFYMALADRRLIPPPPETQIDTVTPDAIYRVLANRAPADWHTWRLPVSAHLMRGIVYGLFSIGLIALSFAPATLLEHLWQNLPGILSFLLTIATPAIAIFVGIVLIIPAMMHLLAAIGRGPRDTIILTPDSCTVQIFQMQRLRMMSLPHRYLFRRVGQASVQHGAWGRVSVLLTDAINHQMVRIDLPLRWHDREAIATQIVQAIGAYQQQAAIVHAQQQQHMAASAPAVESLAPTVPRPQPSAPPPVMPYPQAPYPQATYYTVLASNEQQPLLATVQNWLGQRMIVPGEMVQDRGLILPTARGAAGSRFVLVFITPTLMQSPACQAILADMRRQGKLIIPIRINAAAVLPPELTAVQWVDFSPEIDPTRSLLDLCDTLDRAGIPLLLPGNAFDGSLALARGIHQHAPPTWQVFRPDTSAQRIYRMRLMTDRAYWAVLVVLIAIMAQFFVFSINTFPDLGTAVGVWFAALLLVGLVSFPFLRRMVIRLRATRFWGRLVRGYAVPECCVVTPQGVAFHVIQARQRAAFIDGSYGFNMLRSVERHDGLWGTPQLRLVFSTGAHQDVPLLLFGASADAAIAQAVAAWSAYAAYAQMPTMGAGIPSRQ